MRPKEVYLGSFPAGSSIELVSPLSVAAILPDGRAKIISVFATANGIETVTETIPSPKIK
jgi:hypothetical protein